MRQGLGVSGSVLQDARTRLFLSWLALTSLLVLIKAEVMTFPPYQEYIETIWTEAAFLAETDFDWQRLIRQELQIEEGGVRSYGYTIIPTIAAVSHRLLGPPVTFLLYRLTVSAIASGVMIWTFTMLRRRWGTGRAAMVSTAFFSFPFFLGNLEMLSLEFPLTACVLLSIVRFGERRLLSAARWNFLGYMIKPTILPTTVATIAAFLLWRFSAKDVEEKRRLPWFGLALFVGLFFLEFSILAFFSRDASVAHRDILRAPLILLMIFIMFCPYMIVTFGVVFGIECTWWGKWLVRGWRQSELLSNGRRLFRVGFTRFPELVVGSIYVLLVLASFLNFMFLPRYLVSLSPFLVLITADSLFARLHWRSLGVAFLWLLLIHNAFNTHSRWMLPLEQDARGWASGERSLEYRSDLQSMIRSAKVLEGLPPGEPILVGKLFTHMVASRYMGFVDHPPPGYTVVDAFHLGPLRPAIEILKDRPESIVIVGITTGDYILPPPKSEDEILYEDQLTPPLIIHRHHFGPDAPFEVYENFVRNILRENQAPYTRCSMLASHGYDDLGLEALKQRFRKLNEPPELMRWLAFELEALRSPVSARAIRETLAERPPDPLKRNVDLRSTPKGK